MDILDVCSELEFGAGTIVDFIGKGNIWINDTFDGYVSLFARSILTEAIKKTAPGQLTIYGYDSSISGIFSVFSALSSVDPKFLEIIMNETSLKAKMEYLSQHISSVQNIIQDRYESLLEFRKSAQRPIESYKLVVIYADIAYYESKERIKLRNLLINGPKCGVSFIIISPTPVMIEGQNGKDIKLEPFTFDPEITVVNLNRLKATLSKRRKETEIIWQPVGPEAIVNLCNSYINDYQITPLPSVPFLDLHENEKPWTRSSADGLTFSIGKYGVDSMEVTIGEDKTQRHNAIVTGAVGQGKSNLISVIVHSLCFRYSPKELQLFLMDFKEGVSFKAFSNIDREEYLPHAKALGLECDPEFGYAVLDHLYLEYKKRMKLLKDHNVKSIKEFREKNPNVEMPRIVCVIDEFQLMFDDKESGAKNAGLLEKSVRLFRAAGIHFILASQTLSDNSNTTFTQKKASLFAQVPIRIALKNTFQESRQTLADNNIAAAYLRPREAIVNLDYGELSQNKKAVIAFADEKTLGPIRRDWWEASSDYTTPPYVFGSVEMCTVENSLNDISGEYRLTQRYFAVIGEKLSVTGERIKVPLTRELGRNIAILGLPDEGRDSAMGIIENIALALTVQGDLKKRFIFCDFDSNTIFEKNHKLFFDKMELSGNKAEFIDSSEFDNVLRELLTESNDFETFFFATGLDKWKYESRMGQVSILKEFSDKAPSLGIHFIGWWQKVSYFKSQAGGVASSKPDSFNTRIFLRTDQVQVQSVTDTSVRYTFQENRALVYDSVEFQEPKKIIPYSVI